MKTCFYIIENQILNLNPVNAVLKLVRDNCDYNCTNGNLQ